MNEPMTHPGSNGAESGDGKLSMTQVVGSVFAAAFGVQSRENKVRDFNRGKPLQFILAGLVLTAGLMLTLVTVVTFVL